MKPLLILVFALAGSLSARAQLAQEPLPEPWWSAHYVTYELMPRDPSAGPMQTILFELPVTEDYWRSVWPGQELTRWFLTDGGVRAGLVGRGSPQWRLVVRAKSRR